jgi:hypothetical protein
MIRLRKHEIQYIKMFPWRLPGVKPRMFNIGVFVVNISAFTLNDIMLMCCLANFHKYKKMTGSPK